MALSIPLWFIAGEQNLRNTEVVVLDYMSLFGLFDCEPTIIRYNWMLLSFQIFVI
jgi:hypothetical protein